MTVLDAAALRTRSSLRRTAVGFAALWSVALAAFAGVNILLGARNRDYLLQYGSDAGDRFGTNVVMLLSWIGIVVTVGLATWIIALLVLINTPEMHKGLRTRVRVASALVLVATPVVTVGALLLGYALIVPWIYAGVQA
ncbi:hypothetical protein [Micromonospora chalcea]|uniref:hypothetical protein n=1 Tax=Micromonospora chalcea TaxID=1874 RepID=UPI001656B0DB|nr:hypothetical protein [Micromonospora chalcea]MBC8988932.1 hypothetical protein [Micromonospora chalcea]